MALPLQAAQTAPPRQVLDEVVASVDSYAITRNDVEKAYEFELFQEGRLPSAPPDTAILEAVRDRLVDQTLLLSEADTEGVTSGDANDTAVATLAVIRKKFRSADAFNEGTKALGLTDDQILARLRDRQRILNLIDSRLRPSARIEQPDIETYYKETFVPEMAKRSNTAAPPLSEVEGQIREILTQKRIDELLSSWLESLKSSHRVSVHPF